MTTSRLPWWSPEMVGTELPLVRAVLESNYINDGEVTQEFERRIALLVGAKHGIAVTSGTAAIYLSLVALGVGHGDEVIVPDITFIATANAAAMAGATVVLADVEPETLNLSISRLEAAITAKTKAVVPVHVSGRGADMENILPICAQHGIAVVEDAAEALCSKYKGRSLGTLGRAGCFSFSPNKTITTGQGGVIVTDEDQLAQQLRQLKDQGRPVRGSGGDDEHPDLGFNFKLTNLQAAVGLGQLEKLSMRLERIRKTYKIYRDELADVAGIRILPFDIENGEQPQWVDALATRRDELDAFLSENGAGCRRFWFPLHTQKPYLHPGRGFPNSTRLSKEALWLPSAFQMRDEDAMRVCGLIQKFYGA
jgi:perosamine synthetase